MPKLSHAAFFLLTFIFLADGETLAAAEGGMCSESLGLCGHDCDERCRVRHGGLNPQGSCDYTIGLPLCTCFYSCSSTAPPPPEQPEGNCRGAAGLCSSGCWDDCCNSKCSSQYNQGRGSCDIFFGTATCRCTYVC